MPLLEIDDDVYRYLLSKAVRIGEDGSSILRRVLGLADPGRTTPRSGNGNIGAANAREHALANFLASQDLFAQRNVTDRYLAILGHLAREHGEDFARIIQVRGRKRRYFGHTEAEVAHSGRSMYPRQVPGTKFWAMTNADTAQKQDILAEVLSILGYGKVMTDHARTMIT